MTKKLLYAGATVALFGWLGRKRRNQDQIPPDLLAPLNIEPGPWFRSYLSDWMTAHGAPYKDNVTSGIVTGEISGEYIWVTATPEWDRDWFNARGFQFPSKWIEYKYMDRVVGEDGGSALMPGL